MSLFPAYDASSSKTIPDPPPVSSEEWLSNPSFIKFPVEDPELEGKEVVLYFSSSDSEVEECPEKAEKCLELVKEDESKLKLDFDGSEEFYVDKKRIPGYLKVEKLYKPACPIYRTWNRLGRIQNREISRTNKRYFSKKFTSKLSELSKTGSGRSFCVSEEDFVERNKQFNIVLVAKPNEISKWIEFVNFQDNNPMKSITNTQLAERKIDILDKALLKNPNDDRLYSLYVDILNRAFPSFEVSKIIEKLIANEPTNPVLWRGLIMATQGSMARCNVPDVLKIYEKAMQKMYKINRSDEIMLGLFRNCAYFLRQSGLFETFFGLIKLALELNVSPDRFSAIEPNESEQQILVDYEEVVLASGLPMNEIWLRIEKLRTNYFFLPCPPGFTCSDPQRVVFNEDVCFFIYPLLHKENSMKLVLLILRLLKIPLPNSHLTEESRNESEFDCVEDILSVFFFPSFAESAEFDRILWDLIKELSLGPSFFGSSIGHEIYVKTVLEILHLLSGCFDGVERMVFNLIWLRFERVLVVINRFCNKLTEEKRKQTKSRIRKFLKVEENRNEICYFVEYGLIEEELGNHEMSVNILESSLIQDFVSMANKDKYNIGSNFAEIAIRNKEFESAITVLTSIALNIPYSGFKDGSEVITDNKKLLAVSYLQKNLDNLVAIEKNVDSFEEEQLTLPDFLINSIKCLIYAKTLIKSKSEAVKTIRINLKSFSDKSNKRHTFIREKLHEILLNVQSLSFPNNSEATSWDQLNEALLEFPNNLFLNKKMVTFKGQLWHKLKQTALNCHSSIPIFFLIASIRHRYSEEVQQDIAPSVSHKLRVKNLLKTVTSDTSKLRKNPLMWRLYLRILFEMEKSFDQCKNALYSALDECPWNKSLYMDGAIYVSQELTQIQDLIIEKQLRIYALPEELEILRSDTK